MSDSDYIYVATPAGLRDALASLRAAPAVAVDTEFARIKTYYPIAGLAQLYDGRRAYLLDPLALPGLDGLAELLLDPGIVKVLHAGGEDMEVFHRMLGATPVNVFDTQIAAAALGVGFSLGYQALVERCLGRALPKDKTRSDWLQRPLSASQLRYASWDVVYLLQVYERQQAALADSPKRSWVAEESARLAKELPTLVPAEEIYRRLKGLAKLDGRRLRLLRSLCAWRETMAREKDLPRRWIAEDSVLYRIAKERPDTIEALRDQAGLTPKQLRKWGGTLVKLIGETRRLPKEDWPAEACRQGAPIRDESIARLRELVEEKARLLEVSPQLLATRRHLEELLRSVAAPDKRRPPEVLSGWRREVIGDELLQAVKEAG